MLFMTTGQFVEMKNIVFEGVIGRGSFAVVHKGRWEGKDVALKRIRIPCSTSLSTSTLPQEVEILRYFCGVYACQYCTWGREE